jgi:Domain of unknown function (DUF4340)
VNPRTTGILFLLLAALGAFVWFYEIGGEAGRKDAEAAAKRLFPGIEASAIQQVELTTNDGKRARLERRGSDWWLAAPLDAPADAFTADAIASTLAQLGSEAVYESPQPLAVYGLEDEGRDLKFQAGEASHVFRLGKPTPIGGNRYGFVGGQTRVYTVPAHAVNALAKSLDDLREKRILRFDADAARRVSLRWPGGKVVLARGDPGWKLEEPIVGPADQTTVEELLSDLSFLRASGFVDTPTPQQEGLLGAPELEVEIETRPEQEGGEARQLKLAIGGRESEKDDRLARADGGPGLFRIPSERLLDFPREVGSYRFRELARFDLDQAERLEIVFQPPGQAAVTVTAIRGDQGWSSTPDAVEPAKLATMIDELSRLRADKILADSMGEAELRELGLAPPNARFTVSGKEGQLAQVDLGVAKGTDGLVARASSGAAVYLLAPQLADVLPPSLEALRSGFLVKSEPAAGAEPEPAPEPDTD